MSKRLTDSQRHHRLAVLLHLLDLSQGFAFGALIGVVLALFGWPLVRAFVPVAMLVGFLGGGALGTLVAQVIRWRRPDRLAETLHHQG